MQIPQQQIPQQAMEIQDRVQSLIGSLQVRNISLAAELSALQTQLLNAQARIAELEAQLSAHGKSNGHDANAEPQQQPSA